MLAPLLSALRAEGVPVSLREWLDFLSGLAAAVAPPTPDGLHAWGRIALVKDERHLDRYDRAFGATFGHLPALPPEAMLEARALPREWLEKLAEGLLSPEERAAVQGPGSFEALMDRLRERLAEQKGRHQGGSKWIGTAGTSPFGAYGYNPEGVRIGQDASRHRRAVKVWDRREFRDFDDQAPLSPRNLQVALKRLRQWARTGAEEELDLPGTIRATARAGHIDIVTRPERRNAVKVLLLLDVGGSMDDHIALVDSLFTAARAEFRHLEHYYFHNCLYGAVWRDNRRRWSDQIPTMDLLHRFGRDWKVIVVGDAAMSPWEIVAPGGASEHWNDEAGEVWLRRLTGAFPGLVWLNPIPREDWRHTPSIGMIRTIVEDRMEPLTLEGLTAATRRLG